MIRTEALRVDYGSLTAVNNVYLHIGAGEIYGLIGPNGAGKTSTIRVLATLQEPTYGDVFIAGHDIVEHRREAQSVLGYMPDYAPVYDDLTVSEFLRMFAGAYSVPQPSVRIDEVVQLTRLGDKLKIMCGTLSRGWKQRLVLAKTLLHRPKVLLLDEPASGLDPIARMELRDILKGLADGGATVLISSHILAELSGFCSSIGIMTNGVLKVHGKVEDVIAGLSPHRQFTMRLLRPDSRVHEVLAALPEVQQVQQVDYTVSFDFTGSDEDAARLLAELVSQQVPIVTFSEQSMDVEDVFVQVGLQSMEEQ